MKRRLKLLDGNAAHGQGDSPAGDGEGPDPERTDGFSLHFDRGRAILRLERLRLSELADLDLLEMSIPKLTFPFDVSGGVRGLRRRRLKLHRLRLSARPAPIVEAAAARAAANPWIGEVRAAVCEDAITVLVDYGPSTHRVPLSFRLVPETGGGALAFAVDEARCYGPLPGPLAATPLAALGAIDWCAVRGCGVRIRDPLRLALLAVDRKSVV